WPGPSQPTTLSSQLITLNVESKIHSQPSVARDTGAAQGIRMTKRTSARPGKRFSRARARMFPHTITVSWDTNVKMNEFLRDRWNTGFRTTLGKFWSPTNENSRLPADELVRLRNTASRKGSPTSAAM